ncbi:MAG: nicotinate (nicotinamide) nucleotide adenylyltransferase, partial [Christensenellaceae bacterium]|nr:nicotinate (nicotinamide) nucleotide adenylyltransferase [Christensenellaceae bacterium]
MRFGLFGGAFDPLHNEHVEILELAHKMLKTDAIILVPSHNPPHKDKRLAPFAKRLEMLNEYFADKSHVIIDDIESVRDISDNYACEIIPVIKEKYGGNFVYIIGGDSLADIETWRNPKDIIANTPIVAIARPGFGDLHKKARELNAQYGGKVSVIEYSGEGVSSSEIKAKIETGITQNVPVPNQVLEYIIKNGLYTEHKDIVYKLKKNISNELFEHCARTAIFASHYAGMLRLGFRKVFLAALLHDCAKEMKPLKSEYPTKSSKVIHQY